VTQGTSNFPRGRAPLGNAPPRPRGQPINLNSARFILRSAGPADATERWIGWAGDPTVMTSLNTSVVQITRDQLTSYIAGFNDLDRFLITIYERDGGGQIGFYMVMVDRGHRVATFHVVIGEKSWWGAGVVNESRAVLLDHFFGDRGIEKACGNPNGRNHAAIFNYKAQGWRLEGIARSQLVSVADGSRLDEIRFGLLKAEWMQRREARS
jgi:RimJ/RimL family protein N-acetyltransferase